MNSKYILYCIVTALIIVGIYQIVAVGRVNYPEYNLKEGQVSEVEIIAPFDFPVLKSPQELAAEKEQVLSQVDKPYEISEEPLFEAISNLDNIYAVLCSIEPTDDWEKIASDLKRAGYSFSPEALEFTLRSSLRDRIYESLRRELGTLYNQGIYESLEEDSILIWQNDNPEKKALSDFLPREKAKEILIDKFPEAKTFVSEFTEQYLKPNLLVNEEKLNELNQSSLQTVQPSEGMVLKNEVIVRKNSRVTEEEVRKLESLQEAYKRQKIRKSPLQEMFLSLGLLMFIFVVIFLANHYYGVQSKEEKIPVADFLPVNLGFIVLVILTVLSNFVLSGSNLIIPFAMIAIAGAILVNFEFGLLYSVCNILVISPFLNWETFTPVIMLLSTIMCLLILRRQKVWHEYLMIWLYLLISLLVVIICLGIYKRDSIITIMRSIGYAFISASLSITGILLIVPYYEKKWNRATKQTLLELLDFNHPLLKRLATEAVGTYHHSLVVGNLAEHAAEAIGANPLLARVGSYYHDIGKIINPEIFTENNEDSSEIHSQIEPNESAQLIRNHVTEGITLAKKYKIPQPVIDIIMQHHGDMIIRYFYEKANKEGKELDTNAYRYPGPRPQTKEAALVMLADIVESTTKAKEIESETDIAKIIDETITYLLKEKQFDEAPISMKDLKIVKQSFIPVLESIYRKRLDYPEAQKDE
ncbi:MAG TPA: HDIG domain-containing protein [Candidatus Cloacimonas acidaminovorans]|nr:HDIG domain-containing protein [Candidatus Cloacimonas acidaminovorans]HRS61275.1 HDIG domain-containing protein [Candidatus Cloacimonas sp.]HOE55582.1 HDIG domain-containing protein [Candidatus Cloacimonas acidaminovorans]HOM79656.1 HDIG domain-containing protein [Candidatus Cloacimonas acidaminovorans]HOS07843.1 HDIG domain-containing protein [Candidatus Cloacimonas acidaminovorans]